MAGGFCAQPPPLSTWITKVKCSSISERRPPLATCSATMRDGLCFAGTAACSWHHGDKCKTAPGVVGIVPWFTSSESLNLLLILVGEGVRRRGCLLSLPTYVSFSCKKCWAGWEICSVITGALDRQNRITLILGFCLFPVLQQQGALKQLAKTAGLSHQQVRTFLVCSCYQLNWLIRDMQFLGTSPAR